MGLVSKTYTFSAGAVIVAAQHNTNFDTLYSLVNGNVDTNNISATASIVDTQLAQITTANKVSGTAITTGNIATSGSIAITSTATTTNPFQVIASSLTTGFAAYIYSNSTDATARSLMRVHNDNPAASGAKCIEIIQDAAEPALQITNTSATSSAIEITASSTTTNVISFSPGALTTGIALNISSANALTTGSVAYFHSASSDSNTRNIVSIVNDNPDATGATALYIQQDADKFAFRVAAGCTTSDITYITGDSLTTGSAASLYSDSADTSSRNLLQIVNDNTLATGARGMLIRQDSNAVALAIDYNGTTDDTTCGLQLDGCSIANGSANVTISNVAPAGVGTATISAWLRVNIDSAAYYIPMWT